MGQHKHNPTAIAAKNGELKPKETERHITDSEFMEFIEDTIIKHTGLSFVNLTTGEDAAIREPWLK